MIDYTRVAEFIKECQYILEKGEEVNKATLEKLLETEDLTPDLKEETLSSVWNVIDINKLCEKGHISKDEKSEMMYELEDNLRILAKASLLRELFKEIQLAEKYNEVVDFRVGYKFKYTSDGDMAEVLDFKLRPGLYNKENNEGLALCKREDPARPYVVWKVYIKKLSEKSALGFGSGEYFETEEAAQEYFNLQSV